MNWSLNSKEDFSPSATPEVQAFLAKLSRYGKLERSEAFKRRELRYLMSSPRPSHTWSKYVFAPAGAALIVLTLSGSAVLAAQTSLPGTPLYPVKRLSEKVAVLVNPSLRDEVVVRRSEEVKSLVTADSNPDAVSEALQDFQVEASSVATTSAEFRRSIKNLDEAKSRSTGQLKSQVEKTLNELHQEGDVKGTRDQKGGREVEAEDHSR